MWSRIQELSGWRCRGFFLIFYETCKAYYRYIIDVETRCIVDMKMDPFQLYSNMTLLDFDVYVQRVYELIAQKAKQQEEEMKKSSTGTRFPHQVINMN